jgi:enoyl-CoA hydratase/carnithine racemase
MVRAGKVVGLVECDILDERQRLVARASSTCMTLRGRRAEGRQVTWTQPDELRSGEFTENREREWQRHGYQLLPEQIDADDRLPGYLREPHLPRFQLRSARVFASSAFTANELAHGATRAYGGVKRLLYATATNPLHEQMELENESIADMARSADAQEALNAFLAKRPPQFSGR